MKCTLDNLKVIVVLRLKTNLTSVLIWNLAWFKISKLSHTVTNLFKSILFQKFVKLLS